MRPQIARLRGLVQRYRIDRRLPPTILELVRGTNRLRAAEAAAISASKAASVIGDASSGCAIGRIGNRRIVTLGHPDRPIDTIALDAAIASEEALAAAGVDAFLVRRSGDWLELGVELDERTAALRALASHLPAGWCLEWHDGSRSGLVTIADASESKHARRARQWCVFAPFEWGEGVIGPEAGVHVTFWHLGTSGELELVGTRGHERFHPESARTVEVVEGHRFRGRAAFPVAAAMERLHDPVDIVITWVDGSDPAWAASFRATAVKYGRTFDESALDAARYRSRDELKYLLRSLWIYCGWVRRIWIVTAGQVPAWFEPVDDRVVFVDHAEIFPPDALPTFNSHAIEASLHHIPGLAEHFVYFNDDVFVARPLRPETFFTSNGLARVFQSGARVHGHEGSETLGVDSAALRNREVLMRRFGRVMTHKPLHAPHPQRRSALERLEHDEPECMAATIHSRFRSATDLSVAASLGQHYGLGIGTAVLGDIESEYVHVESPRLPVHLHRIRLRDNLDTFCINETSDGVGRVDRESLVAELLNALYPVAAPWERAE